MKRINLYLYFFLTFIFVSNNSLACRHTVREIGFSDLGLKTYNLVFFIDSRTPAEQIINMQKYSRVLLQDTNVQMEIIDTDKNKSSPYLRFRTQYSDQRCPFTVFISPDGESMICPAVKTGQSINESSWYLIESMVSSSFREDIVRELIRSLGVVLIIEGSDDAENNRIKDAARNAVREITGDLDQMPKVVNKPPKIIVISHNKINDEKVLLFSLGITGKNKDDAHLTVIYGRGKLAGHLLTGEQINSRRIYNLLSLIGADCECGIDNSWIMGDMIPLRWGPSQQADLSDQLGFDVENPFVKTEMSQIISLNRNLQNSINPLENNILGFAKSSLEISDAENPIPKITAEEIRRTILPGNIQKNDFLLKRIIITIGLIVLVIAITGFSIFLLHKRRAG